MGMTRRDVIKISVLSGAAVGLPVSHALGDSVSGNRIAESRLPKPFTSTFSRVPLAVPVRTDAVNRDSDLPDRDASVPGRDRARPADRPVGLQRDVPGSDDRWRSKALPVRVRQINNLPGSAPDARIHAVDLGAPARPRVAPAVRRLRERHHATRATTRTTSTRTSRRRGRSGTTTTACTTRPRPYRWAWLPSTCSTTTRERGLPIPHGEFDVPLMFADISFNADGSVLFDNNDNKGLYGDVIMVNGQPVAGDEGQAAQVPVPVPQRVLLPGRTSGRWTRATR